MSKCIGFGEREDKCKNVAGTPWTPLWCIECDEQRRAHITKQFETILHIYDEDGSRLSEFKGTIQHEPFVELDDELRYE